MGKTARKMVARKALDAAKHGYARCKFQLHVNCGRGALEACHTS